jgi:anti-sigma regulatory factor (Ser/Thr protein kinase)
MESDDELQTLAHRDITAASLPDIRDATTELAQDAGLDPDRADRFALAVHEAAANTVHHADSTGELTVIRDDETTLYAQVADHGPGMIVPASRDRPPTDAVRGRGLWLSEQMADRMQVDSDPDGTVVRLEMALGENPDASPNPSDKQL